MSIYIPNNELGLKLHCLNCGKSGKDIRIKGKSKGLCNWCYRKLIWKQKLITCKRCERTIKHQAKGLCPGCYNSVFHIEKVKLHNARRYHNIDFETYKKATEKCIICGFDKIVDLHHIDMNHKNNFPENLTGLCPNHHKMIHHREYQKEVFQLLKEKGFKEPEIYKDDEVFKNF